MENNDHIPCPRCCNRGGLVSDRVYLVGVKSPALDITGARGLMSDRDFIELQGWTETQEGWINRKAAPFAAPMSLSDAAKIQRILDKWSKEPYEPPKDDLNRVRVRCENCHQKLTVNADWCEANDWPECCGGRMEVVEG